MFGFIFGFALGVVGGPVFMAKVWPKIKEWWDNQSA